MQHKPRKRFGQNFLKDPHIIEQIVTAIQPHPEDNMVEVGPGLGALTRPLLTHLQHLTVIEIDQDLHENINKFADDSSKITLIGSDVLTVDFTKLGEKQRIVGNLPYNISTPLLFHLLAAITHISDMHFMLQKEVVNRLSAEPHSKAYGRLSVMIQAHCDVEPLFDVPPQAFHPAPKVESSIVRLTPRAEQYDKATLDALEKLLAIAFQTRRKTLSNNLKKLMHAHELLTLDIDPKRRPETLTLKEYVKLAQYLIKSCKIA